MTTEQKLDKMLFRIANPLPDKPAFLIEDFVREIYPEKDMMIRATNQSKWLDEMEDLFNKLIKDGFIKTDSTFGVRLSIEGELFEGYGKKKYRLNLKSSQMKNVQCFQIITTILLSIGTIGLLIWEILKYFLENHCLCH